MTSRFWHGNFDNIIVIVAVDSSIRMVALATWNSIAIAAGDALIIAALVARISHIGCVAPTLALAWLSTRFNVPWVLGTLLPGVPDWWGAGWQVVQARLAAIAFVNGASRLPATGLTGATVAAVVIAKMH